MSALTALAGLGMMAYSTKIGSARLFDRGNLHLRLATKELDRANARLNKGKCGQGTMTHLRAAQFALGKLQEDIDLLGIKQVSHPDDREALRVLKDTSAHFARLLTNHHSRFGRCIADETRKR